MEYAREHGLPLWRSPILHAVPGVWHCFTSRNGGVGTREYATFNLSATVGDDPASVRANRARLARAAGVDAAHIRLQTQVHGAAVVELGGGTDPEPVVGDAFVSTVPGVPALIGVADCCPVLLAVEDGRVVAAVHAGWRGAVGGVVPAAVAALHERHGAPPSALVAAIGPTIGPCCLEVGDDVAAQFPLEDVVDTRSKPHVDLPGTVARQLVAAGVRPDRIDRADVCTRCNGDLCFSHRGGRGKTGRMVAMIVRTTQLRSA